MFRGSFPEILNRTIVTKDVRRRMVHLSIRGVFINFVHNALYSLELQIQINDTGENKQRKETMCPFKSQFLVPDSV